ncbi:short-chain dehydrogenase [Paenibacillus borealis]|uniref:short-chain dehydrogenase n=1 Tax=Paenibacillus borealis TaxID=160799 RepID=UPI000ACA9404|nr:short-chain dehydrogenase [Paenibacillus borealis]
MTDPVVRDQHAAVRDKLAMTPDAAAHAIAYAIEQPDNIDVNKIVIRPAAQV